MNAMHRKWHFAGFSVSERYGQSRREWYVAACFEGATQREGKLVCRAPDEHVLVSTSSVIFAGVQYDGV